MRLMHFTTFVFVSGALFLGGCGLVALGQINDTARKSSIPPETAWLMSYDLKRNLGLKPINRPSFVSTLTQSLQDNCLRCYSNFNITQPFVSVFLAPGG
jgi:hypothetical protein